MRSGFPNKGNRTIAARIALWAAIEMINARRRMRRSRARCSLLPSTKQPCKEPKSFCEWGSGSIGITHLHKKVLRVRTGIFATPASCGCSTTAGDRRRARRDVRCARPHNIGHRGDGQVPARPKKRCLLVRKRQQRSVAGQFPLTALIRTLPADLPLDCSENAWFRGECSMSTWRLYAVHILVVLVFAIPGTLLRQSPESIPQGWYVLPELQAESRRHHHLEMLQLFAQRVGSQRRKCWR